MSNEELVTLYQNGDKQVLEGLIENNEGIVRKLAYKYRNINKLLELDDLIQSGYVGLITAANKYKVKGENSSNFITFAYIIIKQEILKSVNGRGSKEIANNKFYKSCSRLNAFVGENEDTELIETIDGDDKSLENIEDKIYIEHLRGDLEKAMDEYITPKERNILKLHFGWDCKPYNTYEAIADVLGIRGNGIRASEYNAFRKIRWSPWYKSEGKKYVDEIIGPRDYTYGSVEKRFDEELKSLYAM
ncbi:sigma-70 family RNA polymerase sigma factor [Clostridium butyricum]|uniref:RNA polymerase sigma-70 domain-containing protein n=1 Tax=Clostridium butyricum TaxID=1492 RepID=A0A2S7FCY0_CLOBU|nr:MULTISPECIES: sigma-70 family RNA polymerase sigma factor [Clostridium]KHD14965.1 hypothetical protein OA81_12760 [Clostridium butyricum]MDU1602821.1 sigma-70 family RNA polymerase sigma factor [Clostridium sp.]PPV16030.1 hypothetical protein AWN73_10795 [Clostridium butyricum]